MTFEPGVFGLVRLETYGTVMGVYKVDISHVSQGLGFGVRHGVRVRVGDKVCVAFSVHGTLQSMEPALRHSLKLILSPYDATGDLDLHYATTQYTVGYVANCHKTVLDC